LNLAAAWQGSRTKDRRLAPNQLSTQAEAEDCSADVASLDRELVKLSLRLEGLAGAVQKIGQSSSAALGTKLRTEIGYLETVVGCLHKCFHDDEVITDDGLQSGCWLYPEINFHGEVAPCSL
jgi:hypothetical protein